MEGREAPEDIMAAPEGLEEDIVAGQEAPAASAAHATDHPVPLWAVCGTGGLHLHPLWAAAGIARPAAAAAVAVCCPCWCWPV